MGEGLGWSGDCQCIPEEKCETSQNPDSECQIDAQCPSGEACIIASIGGGMGNPLCKCSGICGDGRVTGVEECETTQDCVAKKGEEYVCHSECYCELWCNQVEGAECGQTEMELDGHWDECDYLYEGEKKFCDFQILNGTPTGTCKCTNQKPWIEEPTGDVFGVSVSVSPSPIASSSLWARLSRFLARISGLIYTIDGVALTSSPHGFTPAVLTEGGYVQVDCGSDRFIQPFVRSLGSMTIQLGLGTLQPTGFTVQDADRFTLSFANGTEQVCRIVANECPASGCPSSTNEVTVRIYTREQAQEGFWMQSHTPGGLQIHHYWYVPALQEAPFGSTQNDTSIAFFLYQFADDETQTLSGDGLYFISSRLYDQADPETQAIYDALVPILDFPPSAFTYLTAEQGILFFSLQTGLIVGSCTQDSDCEAIDSAMYCSSAGYCAPPHGPQCSDGIDNDGDTFKDFPEDPECMAEWDDLEHDPSCGDGMCEGEESNYCDTDCHGTVCGDRVCAENEWGWCAADGCHAEACVDSDPDADPFVRGYVEADGRNRRYDYCLQQLLAQYQCYRDANGLFIYSVPSVTCPYGCLEGVCLPPPIPGNGIVEYGEACDDGNTTSGDGCSADCTQIERPYVCPPLGGPCVLLLPDLDEEAGE